MSHRPRSADRRGGFTLLEVLIAAMLLVIGMVGSIALILGLLQANKTARARDTGYFLAQQALDNLEMVPLVGSASVVTSTGQPAFLATAFPYAAVPFPSEPTCYSMSDDVLGDRPVSCAVGQGSSFIVRTWTCCSTPLGATNTIPATASCLLNAEAAGAITGAISSPDAVPTGGASVNPNGAVCLIQAEVTWPLEDPIGMQVAVSLATAQTLFQDYPASLGYGPIASKTLDRQPSGHVWATLVRAQ